MKFNDLRQFNDNLLIETDLCIVGSGPAGLSIAKEFVGTNVQVWIVESGGLEEEPDTQALYNIESIGVPRVMQQEIIRSRIFGGSSHVWTGRCAPFDPLDFQSRPWIPNSGWPIDREQLDPYLERAGINLGLGPHCYDQRLWELFKVSRPEPLLDENLLKPAFWQFSKSAKDPAEPTRFGHHFMPEHAPNINVLLHANVTHLNTNETGTCLESIEVSTLEHKRGSIKAKAIILCCGGIENARLLLASNRILPNGVGNPHDTVGRFLMDHPGCVIGGFDPQRSTKVRSRFGQYWLDNQQGRHVYLQGVALSPTIQAQEGLLNCAAFLEEYSAPDDPWTALRRLKTALKKQPPHSSPTVDQAMFWRQPTASATSGLPPSPYRDVLAVLSHPQIPLQGLYRRFVKHRPALPKAERIDLYCLVEQLPDPSSRITLSETKDALGMPISKINWQMSDREMQTVRRLSQVMGQEFKRLGLPQPILANWLNDKENWQSNFIDRAHPIGTTRISENPQQGVVNSNCQVHGVEGLFIAGSSVFPTTGHANPTLMIVAMSIRLADWLKINCFHQQGGAA
ncbi:MAG: GMC family oxidoreductase [Leptolyngbyaceae cyanobacterium CRU_2_3]|nr:GMC family oxidoreductase [Leptolyngbyaceae cyanobacterium CRU_2_3]